MDDIIAGSCAPKDACTFPDSKEIDVILRSSRRHSEAQEMIQRGIKAYPHHRDNMVKIERKIIGEA